VLEVGLLKLMLVLLLTITCGILKLKIITLKVLLKQVKKVLGEL
jgi:hypothetical protein